MAPFYSVKIYIKEFGKMLKKLLTFCWTSDNIYFAVARQKNKKKNKLKKLLTKENAHDIISELLLKKVSNNEP